MGSQIAFWHWHQWCHGVRYFMDVRIHRTVALWHFTLINPNKIVNLIKSHLSHMHVYTKTGMLWQGQRIDWQQHVNDCSSCDSGITFPHRWHPFDLQYGSEHYKNKIRANGLKRHQHAATAEAEKWCIFASAWCIFFLLKSF